PVMAEATHTHSRGRCNAARNSSMSLASWGRLSVGTIGRSVIAGETAVAVARRPGRRQHYENSYSSTNGCSAPCPTDDVPLPSRPRSSPVAEPGTTEYDSLAWPP